MTCRKVLVRKLSTECVKRHTIYKSGADATYWIRMGKTQPRATVETLLKRSYRKARLSDPSSVYSIEAIMRNADWQQIVEELKG